jgi:predicted RNase H-like nuclease
VSAQAWGIYGKVRDLDRALASDANAQTAIVEVHPEVCFWVWSARSPMKFSKKKREGRGERLALAEDWLGEGILARARGGHLKKDLADDDILDAIAALWTAHRIADGSCETLPESPPVDETGLPMQIVF